MYLQEILEVAIGLVFAWLVISVAVMSINEWIGNILNRRANEMEKVIAQMLSADDLGKNFTEKFYEHPLIANLYHTNSSGKKARLPSYIPAQKFGAAVFDLVLLAGTDNSPVHQLNDKVEAQLELIQSPENRRLAQADWQAILDTAKQVGASGLGSAALESLKHQVQVYGEKYPEVTPSVDSLLPELDTYYGQFVEEQRTAAESGADAGLTMRQFRLGLLALEKTDARLYESISALIRQVETTDLRADQMVGAVRVNLETWFNDAMSRLSGRYKQKTQVVSFILGCILALSLNVDSVSLATSLWREPTLRQAILAEAQNYTPPATSQTGTTPGPLESIPALETQLQVLNIPFGWTAASFDTGARQCSLLPLQKNQVWGIPSKDAKGLAICKRVNNLPTDVYAWLLKILGMLMTGAAATQGAPFWFEMLGKLVNVRGTGANPAEKQPVG